MSELPVELVEDEQTGDRFLIYADLQGLQLDIHFRDETLWMTQDQIARLFARERSVITKHISNVLEEGELAEDSSVQKLHTTQGRPPLVYNLDMVISVGYRVSSSEATRFRRWATSVLVQYARKGFVVDIRRMKSGDSYDRIAELREIVRDIRADEANVYRELKRICALAIDYDPNSAASLQFFQRTQARFVYAVVSQTPAEIIHSRADHRQANMGLKIWPRDEIRKTDALISKNYLAEAEIRELNRLTTILLDIFEDQMDLGRIAGMDDAARLLETQLSSLSRKVLRNGGSVSAEVAHCHAADEYALYDAARKFARRSEADIAIEELAKAIKKLPKTQGAKKS